MPSAGEVGSAWSAVSRPVYGRTGTSKAPLLLAQPVPESRVRPNPRSWSAPYSYPPQLSPPLVWCVVGVNWTMPKGSVAPGQVLP